METHHKGSKEIMEGNKDKKVVKLMHKDKKELHLNGDYELNQKPK